MGLLNPGLQVRFLSEPWLHFVLFFCEKLGVAELVDAIALGAVHYGFESRRPLIFAGANCKLLCFFLSRGLWPFLPPLDFEVCIGVITHVLLQPFWFFQWVSPLRVSDLLHIFFLALPLSFLIFIVVDLTLLVLKFFLTFFSIQVFVRYVGGGRVVEGDGL